MLCLVPLASAAQSEETVPRPDVRVGDRWTYRATGFQIQGFERFEVAVTFVDQTTIHTVYTGKGDKEADTTWTREWNLVADPDGIVFRPSSLTFRFPMKVGDRREYEFETLVSRGAARRAVNWRSNRIVGWEDVEVPAGKFRALKIEIEGYTQRMDVVGVRATSGAEFWYVPRVERWVKAIYKFPAYTRIEELVETSIK